MKAPPANITPKAPPTAAAAEEDDDVDMEEEGREEEEEEEEEEKEEEEEELTPRDFLTQADLEAAEEHRYSSHEFLPFAEAFGPAVPPYETEVVSAEWANNETAAAAAAAAAAAGSEHPGGPPATSSAAASAAELNLLAAAEAAPLLPLLSDDPYGIGPNPAGSEQVPLEPSDWDRFFARAEIIGGMTDEQYVDLLMESNPEEIY